jgi:GGDEF domain-containing protein
MQSLQEPIALEGGAHAQVGCSIGVAFADAGKAAKDLLEEADASMYAAKRAGKGRISYFAQA